MNTGRKINITFLASTLPVGGAEHILLELIKHLNRDSFDVNVLCLKAGGSIGEEFRRMGIRVLDNLMSWRFDASISWRLSSILKQLKPDVLYMFNHDDAMLWGKVSSRIAGVPVVLLWVHSSFIPGKTFLVRAVNRLTINMVSRIIAISETHKKSIESNYPALKENKLEVIYNGLDIDAYDSTCANRELSDSLRGQGFEHIVGTIARLSPEKNLEVLFRASRIVLDEQPRTLFLVVGDGPERQRYEGFARELGIENNVRFLGMRSDVPSILKIFDLAVLSSKEEVFPMFLLEAMASRLPVVSTRVGSIEEIVQEGRSGFLVEKGDHRGLADRILRLINEEELSREMGNRGRDIVEQHFTVERMVTATERLITDLLRTTTAS